MLEPMTPEEIASSHYDVGREHVIKCMLLSWTERDRLKAELDRLTSSTEAQAPQDTPMTLQDRIDRINRWLCIGMRELGPCDSRAVPDWMVGIAAEVCSVECDTSSEAKAEPAPLRGPRELTDAEDELETIRGIANATGCTAPTLFGKIFVFIEAWKAYPELRMRVAELEVELAEFTSRPECGVPTRDAVVDREAAYAVARSIFTSDVCLDSAIKTIDALIASGIIKAMPTREEIARTLYEVDISEVEKGNALVISRAGWSNLKDREPYYQYADALLRAGKGAD